MNGLLISGPKLGHPGNMFAAGKVGHFVIFLISKTVSQLLDKTCRKIRSTGHSFTHIFNGVLGEKKNWNPAISYKVWECTTF